MQQRELNLYEAHSSNRLGELAARQAFISANQAKLASEQNDKTGAQSVIILLFTVVTIIFVSFGLAEGH